MFSSCHLSRNVRKTLFHAAQAARSADYEKLKRGRGRPREIEPCSMFKAERRRNLQN